MPIIKNLYKVVLPKSRIFFISNTYWKILKYNAVFRKQFFIRAKFKTVDHNCSLVGRIQKLKNKHTLHCLTHKPFF